MNKHTAEPWSVDLDEDDDLAANVTISAQEAIMAQVLGPGEFPCLDEDQYGAVHAENVATAQRIVACVNALAGINPEAAPDLLAACEMFERYNTENCQDESATTWDALVATMLAALAKAKE